MNYFRLGRIYGINIHVNWSWLLIFALVSWSLSLTFGQIHQEWSINMRWTMAVLAAFLFFVSVLAHELAHSLVALARGVPVANITLFLLGGVSNMQREPSSAAEEFVITVVCPLTSLFLGAVCLAVDVGGMVLQAGSLIAPGFLSELQLFSSLKTNFIKYLIRAIPRQRLMRSEIVSSNRNGGEALGILRRLWPSS